MHPALLALCLAAILVLREVNAFQFYQQRIPNGVRVPNPCPVGGIWGGVGHQNPSGADARNPFGIDFNSAGARWTAELCRKDSDGDGLSNGQELGDPNCVWTPGATPARTTGLSHPGICPLTSSVCVNSWAVCPELKTVISNCSALTEANVTMRNFTISENTSVPAIETVSMCQAFELNNTASGVHMIGSQPIIDNKDVLRHMRLYSCASKPDQGLFVAPRDCSTIGGHDCLEPTNLWSHGETGECFDSNAGFLVGGSGGIRYALLQVNWSNRQKGSNYTDSSGFSLYFTSQLRQFNMGTLLQGELSFVLPPRQQLVSVSHTCPSVCTSFYPSEPRYISTIGIRMNSYGVQSRISQWRNGTLFREMFQYRKSEFPSVDYLRLARPVDYQMGDEIKTECFYNTLDSNASVFSGTNQSDESCFSYMVYYPNDVSVSTSAKLGRCLSVAGINQCWLQSGLSPHVEQGCNITAMISGALPNQTLAEMTANRCFARIGCDVACRNYLNNTLWPSNACYDPKRARQMAEVMATGLFVEYPVNLTIANTLFGQRFCEREISMLVNSSFSAQAQSSQTSPATSPVRMASPNLLIFITVCSLLFLLGLAIFVGFAVKTRCWNYGQYESVK